jgi:Undecaprenyl-phosphate glucose phosphotransferase
MLPQARFTVGGIGISLLVLMFEILSIAVASVASGAIYHLVIYGDAGPLEFHVAVGLLAAGFYVVPYLLRDEYRVQDFLDGRRSASRVFLAWNYAFLCLAMIGFLTKTTDVFSRGGLLMFYVAGLLVVLGCEALIRRVLRRAIRNGLVMVRRVMLVGAADEIGRMAREIAAGQSGVRVVATAVLPEQSRAGDGHAARDMLARSLEVAVAEARAGKADDIVILTDWARSEIIGRIVDAFSVLPVSVHLGATGVIGRFSEARVARIGRATALSLTDPPLGPAEAFVKRTFDILVAGAALVLLSPLLAVVAALVRLDSPGPVFFRQRRRGYNLEEFRIWKFRTMTTLDDGPTVVQARPGDARVTRIGRTLRRLNLDELPQLVNVLKGEMSIVGPRPHAVAHDLLFEKRIVAYPRRLKVKPGITGWAQINGFRGSTDTDDAMRARVDHDIYYIDNWSIWLDLYIIAMTVLSPRAYRNAH